MTTDEREAARAARLEQAAAQLGWQAKLEAEARARVPPALTVREALARRAQVMRAAAVRARHPWIASKEI
jgi:hypothetical protein